MSFKRMIVVEHPFGISIRILPFPVARKMRLSAAQMGHNSMDSDVKLMRQ